MKSGVFLLPASGFRLPAGTAVAFGAAFGFAGGRLLAAGSRACETGS